MNEDRSNELLERCDSPIERKLLTQLYPHLPTAHTRRELCAQYKIDRYHDMPVTIPDFAFPKAKIAIYCDGFKWHGGNRKKFASDRLQSRELQLRGWIVLRFTGSEKSIKARWLLRQFSGQLLGTSRNHNRTPTSPRLPTLRALIRDSRSRQPPHASFVAKLHNGDLKRGVFMLNNKQIVCLVAGVIACFLSGK